MIGRVDLPAPHEATLRWPALPNWRAAATAVLARRLGSLEPRRAELCVWSCELARHLFEALADGRLDVPRVCVDVDHPLRRAARLPGLAAGVRCDVRWQAADPGVQRWLIARGIDPGRITLAPAWFEPPAERFTLRHQVRRRLRLEPEQRVAVVLPPICRESGAFEAVWGAMLAEKVEPRLRVILPGGSREAERIMRLVAACRHGFFVRRAPDASLPELLAAADVALLCARSAVSQTGLLSAAAAGLAVVATRAADAFGLLEADRSGAVVDRVEPADIARALLAVLREPAAPRAAGRALRQRFEQGVARATGGAQPMYQDL